VIEVTVEACWRSETSFEFETQEEADAFREKVGGGGDEGLKAIVDAGDVTSQLAELTDFEVMG
jgi:hypothetical protein